jgi:nitrogen fixation/metabolism regulation signal transduction histidine kinase
VQRRLFILFLLLSLIPAVTILAVNWQISQRHLGFLDSPGLRDALESSLDLARGELTRQMDQTAEIAARIEPDSWAVPEEGAVLILVRDGRIIQSTGEPDSALIASLLPLAAANRRDPIRIDGTEQDWVAAVRDIESGTLILARPLDALLTRHLDAVSQGGARIRQLRLYYGDLMRGDTLATLLVLGLTVLVVALLLSRTLARRIAAPIHALAVGTRKVADGELNHHVNVEAPAEIGQLITAFNRMTDDLRTSKEDLIQAERVAAWRGVARRLAHEIKNPLTPITLAMHRISKRVDDPAVVDSVQTVLEETENLKRLADEFSQYARLPAPQPESVDLGDLLQSVLDLYTEDERLEVVWTRPREAAPVRVDPGQIRQALANLVKNAVAAVNGSGRISLQLRRDADQVILQVADSGPGLPDPCDRVFEPYFTTKTTGTGLGLPISRKIVEDHRGQLTAANDPAGGAVFQMVLPDNRSPKQEDAE